MSRVLAIIGPSGSGKSSVVRELHRRGLVHVHPTWTTRPLRDDEAEQSLEHRFVDDTTFDALVAKGFFVDTVEMFGLPYRYGLPSFVERPDDLVTIVMVRAPLVERLRSVVDVWRTYQIECDDRQAQRRLHERRTGVVDLRARVFDNERERVLGRPFADRAFLNDRTIAALADRVAAALRTDSRVAS